MRGQPVLADVRIIDQAALDHVPADQALHSAEYEHQPVFRPLLFADVAFGRKYQERHKEHDADQATEQAMQEFEPENALECLNIHVCIDLLELWRLLVHLERRPPLGIGQRRQNARDRFPVNHRQAGPRESCHATQHNHRKYQRATNEQPERYAPVSDSLLFKVVHMFLPAYLNGGVF